jgi:poly(3-hydroxybutyrate) depolymerase
MKKNIIYILLISIATLLCSGLKAQERKEYTMRHDGIERSYWLYLPENRTNTPLVLCLHGYGGQAE